jgi:hypothetical protein
MVHACIALVAEYGMARRQRRRERKKEKLEGASYPTMRGGTVKLRAD